jgi:hypothetical protein
VSTTSFEGWGREFAISGSAQQIGNLDEAASFATYPSRVREASRSFLAADGRGIPSTSATARHEGRLSSRPADGV